MLAALLEDFLPHHRSGAGLSFVLSARAANHLRALIVAIGLGRFALFLLAACILLLLLAAMLAQHAAAAALAQEQAERERLETRRSIEATLHETARRKDEFIAMLGHELRNPLASISMALEIIRRAPGEPEAAWAQDAAGRQLQLLTRLVDDLLDVSRISEGKIRLQTAPTDLVSVVANAVETTRPLLRSLGHQLMVQTPREPLFMLADGVRLTQAVANLLNNAAKYTDAGGRIELSLSRDGDSARIAVKDSGIGIAPAALETIFDIFTQVPLARPSVGGGLGVGLALVKSLVEMHGGSVRATSPGEGHGSEFEIRLPLPAGAPIGGGAVASPEPPRLRPTRHVLIADDNIVAAEGLRFILQRQSHAVEVVHDGAVALDAISRGNPDVVLLDIGLPGMNGLEVARLVRQRQGAKRPLLVAITGLGQPDDHRRSALAGFDHHLVKPIDLKLLEQLLADESTSP